MGLLQGDTGAWLGYSWWFARQLSRRGMDALSCRELIGWVYKGNYAQLRIAPGVQSRQFGESLDEQSE